MLTIQEEELLNKITVLCGGIEQNMNEKNEINLLKGGCGKWIPIMDSYRCTDCTASFHRDCARKHFKS